MISRRIVHARLGIAHPHEVEGIANREDHSVAQICEAFLLAGSDAKKQGGKFLQEALARLIIKSCELVSWDSTNRFFR